MTQDARPLKILLLGVFTFGSTDNWKLLALRRLGHRVVPHPYRDVPVEELFPQGEPFDLVFVSKGVPLTAAQLARVASLGRRALLWWPDPFENWNEHLTSALMTGGWRVAATSKIVLSKIGDTVIKGDVTIPAERILEGCDCEGPAVAVGRGPVAPALLHFGHVSPRRHEIIERVRAAGVTVDVHEGPAIFGPRLHREVLAHKAVLGINTSPDLYSNRVQTVLAMGGALLQEDAPGLPDDFGGDFRGLLWNEETLVDRALVTVNASFFPGFGRAAVVFDRYRWERVMERALEFAMGTSR